MVETTSVPQRNPASSSRVIDGQAVIAVSDDAQILILNDIGTRVWSLIDGKRTCEEIVAAVQGQLAEGYEAVPSSVASDVEEFLEDIRTRGLITVNEGGNAQ